MKNKMVEIMSELTELSKEEVLAIEESFPIKTYKKGTVLLKEGQIPVDTYFVIKGCIRIFQLLDGEEKTIDFFTEDQSACDFVSYNNKTGAKHFLVCTEETTAAIFNSIKEKKLFEKYPRFVKFCQTEVEQMMGNQQEVLSKFIVMSPEERYLNLLNERPTLINRVPQYQLASYLGIKPETLSRIRKRIVKKSH